MEYKPRKEVIAKRIAQIFSNGNVVNLGIGLPTLVGNYVPEGIDIILQSENGFLGLGPAPEEGKVDPFIVNAGGQPVTLLTGGCYFDSATSFGIIRGGMSIIRSWECLKWISTAILQIIKYPARWYPEWAAPWTLR